MAKGKDEEFKLEYAELRLQYALENDEFRQVFDDWKKEESNLKKIFRSDHKLFHQKINSSKAHVSINKKRNEFKIPYSLIAPFFFKGKSITLSYPSIWVITKHEPSAFFDKDNPKQNIEIISAGFFTSEEMIFNKEKNQFYHRPNDNDPIKREEILEKDKYITLKIDLSQKNEGIKREFESIINYFKRVIDDLNLSKSKSKLRRQDIDLYKKYLRVYKLVQEKGEGKMPEIAKEIFPNEQSDPDKKASALSKVHHYHKEAKRLIAEGLP